MCSSIVLVKRFNLGQILILTSEKSKTLAIIIIILQRNAKGCRMRSMFVDVKFIYCILKLGMSTENLRKRKSEKSFE